MIKLEKIFKYLFSLAIKRISLGLKNVFELALVNELSHVSVIVLFCVYVQSFQEWQMQN